MWYIISMDLINAILVAVGITQVHLIGLLISGFVRYSIGVESRGL